MPDIRLTEETWLQREADFWEGHLVVRLGKTWVDFDTITHWIADLNKSYTAAELSQIRDELVSRGIIEVQ